jgi:hypothetical protein
MLPRWVTCLGVVALFVVPTPARAAEEKATPAVVVGVRSIDAVLANGKYLAKIVGGDELAKQVEGIIKERLGGKGFAGIDTKRPFGFYAHKINNNSFVAMIPVADRKALFKFLKSFDLEPAKSDDGLYTVSPEFLPVEVYFRLHKGYAYITALSKGAVDKDTLLPASTVVPKGKGSLASATLHVDRIPKGVKQLILSRVELQAKRLQRQKPPNETQAQEKVRVRLLNSLAETVSTIIKDGGELGARIAVDRKANRVSTQFFLTGKEGTGLNKKIAALGEATSLFGGLSGAKAAATVRAHFALPDDLRKALGNLIDEGFKDLKKEKNATKRALAEKLLKAIAPTVKAGEADALASLRGPNKAGLYTLVLAAKVKDGKDLEKAVRDVVTKATPESERDRIKFDAEKEGDVSIHRVTLKGALNKKARATFGDSPLYVAFRENAVFAAVGEDGLKAIKQAITAKAKAGPLVRVEVALARLAPAIISHTPDAKVKKALKDAFPDASQEPGKITFSLAGGKALTARFTLDTSVLKFFAQVRQAYAKDEASE